MTGTPSATAPRTALRTALRTHPARDLCGGGDSLALAVPAEIITTTVGTDDLHGPSRTDTLAGVAVVAGGGGPG